jgi:putative DNA primase/helicase
MHDPIDQFAAAIRDAGLEQPESVTADGTLHRFSSNGKRGDDSGWYVLHLDGIPAGSFGCWRTGFKQLWHADIGRALTAQEKAEHRAKIEAMQQQRKAEEARRHAEAATKAAEIWAAAKPAPADHPYLVRKGIKPYGIREHNGALVVPMRIDGKIQSLQFIEADSNKRFLTGGRVKGCYFSIGNPIEAEALCIAEGLATGATIHEATGYPVAIAFNAGNLIAVAQTLRQKFPTQQIIVCADDDHQTDGNPGLTKATEAAQAVDGILAIPDFGNDRPVWATDFNDLAKLRGFFMVQKSIVTVVISIIYAGSSGSESSLESSLPPKNDEAEKLKESLLAEALAADLEDRLIYDEASGDWYRCVNGIWAPISKTRALKIINKQLHAHLPAGFSMSKLNAVESFLRLYLALEKWETNRNLLPLQNGVLDTKTLTLSDYAPQHKFRWQLPYSYKPDAKISIIKRWLWDVTNEDIETVQIIRAFTKIVLAGGDLQRFLEVIGPGGTGKSTLIRLLIMLVGENNHAATDLKNLEQNRFEAATLYGKRLAVISDSSRYGGEVSVLKAITGGDPVRHERKNQQQSGSFVFDGAVIIASNEAIQSTDYSSGLARRRLPIMFRHKITDADKEKWREVGGIENAMRTELPGLLNWVLSMTDDEIHAAIGGIDKGLTRQQREHLVETNKLAAWLDDNIIADEAHVIHIGANPDKDADTAEIERLRASKLYPNYVAWCAANGVQPIAVQRFSLNLLDVCEFLKLPVKKLTKNSEGARIQGLAIRKPYDTRPAIVTLQTLSGDEECRKSAEVNNPGSLENDDCDDCDDVISFHKNADDVEVF